jgi:hypothetical protein
MQTVRLAALAFLLLVLAALSAHAQTVTVLPPGSPVKVAWDAPAVATDGSNAPTGYRFETFRETATGVVVTTTDVPVTALTATLPATALPADGPFLLAVRAFNASGVSDRSNALPFVRPSSPGVPTALRLVP